jgi:hypothetical protein
VQKFWIRVLIVGGRSSLVKSSIMMWSRLIYYQPIKLMSRSGPTCLILIDDDLMLICSLMFWWILGDALTELEVKPNHRWWYLLSCKNFWKLSYSNTKSGAHTNEAPYFLYVVMHMLKVIEVIWSVDREPLAFSYAAMRVLKVIEAVWSIDREPHAFRTWWCACWK